MYVGDALNRMENLYFERTLRPPRPDRRETNRSLAEIAGSIKLATLVPYWERHATRKREREREIAGPAIDI